MRLGDTTFAVTDVETTGLFPKNNDRVIEISILQVDYQANILKEFSTLINPMRDLGPTHIHGITAREVKNAPTFDQIAGNIITMLTGTVFVAHNAFFDRRFVESEFVRLGATLPPFPQLCTMKLAKRAAPTSSSRRLDRLCSYFDIPQSQAHTARSDTIVTSKLMAACFERLGVNANTDLKNLGIDNALPLVDAGQCHS